MILADSQTLLSSLDKPWKSLNGIGGTAALGKLAGLAFVMSQGLLVEGVDVVLAAFE